MGAELAGELALVAIEVEVRPRGGALSYHAQTQGVRQHSGETRCPAGDRDPLDVMPHLLEFCKRDHRTGELVQPAPVHPPGSLAEVLEVEELFEVNGLDFETEVDAVEKGFGDLAGTDVERVAVHDADEVRDFEYRVPIGDAALGQKRQQGVEESDTGALDLVEKLEPRRDHGLGVHDLPALLQLRQVQVVEHVEGGELLVARLVVVEVPSLAVGEEDGADQLHQLGLAGAVGAAQEEDGILHQKARQQSAADRGVGQLVDLEEVVEGGPYPFVMRETGTGDVQRLSHRSPPERFQRTAQLARRRGRASSRRGGPASSSPRPSR